MLLFTNRNIRRVTGDLEKLAALSEQAAKMADRLTDSRVHATVRIGQYRSLDDYRAALQKKDIVITRQADEMLNSPSFSVVDTEVTYDMVGVRISDLEFEKPVSSMQDLHVSARKEGLEVFPAEVGPAMLLQISHLPYPSELRIAMEPIDISKNRSSFFHVRRGSVGWRLDAYFLDAGGPATSLSGHWYSESYFLFCRRLGQLQHWIR